MGGEKKKKRHERGGGVVRRLPLRLREKSSDLLRGKRKGKGGGVEAFRAA